MNIESPGNIEPEQLSKLQRITSLAALNKKGKLICKIAGKQLLVLQTASGVYVCNNRCPHEGFPLSEGTLNEGCVLTCNWHNWKFDLETGETLIGGDSLRVYPVSLRNGEVWCDLTDPPLERARSRVYFGLEQALAENDYERLAREVTRYRISGGDPLDLVRFAFGWAHEKFQYGITHAHAAAADWLMIYDGLLGTDDPDTLIPVVEILGHIAWDCKRDAGRWEFTQNCETDFSAIALENAIEEEDENAAVAQARAAIKTGKETDLQLALARVSLRHYQSFGHSPIYVDKVHELVARFGSSAMAIFLLPLVRSLCFGRREDLIPEFRAYGVRLATWNGRGSAVPAAETFRQAGVPRALALISDAAGELDALDDVLMEAIAGAMLYFDENLQNAVDQPVSNNVDWLDFSHALTHLQSARKLAEVQPGLKPNAYLQCGCFLGRNSRFVNWNQNMDRWKVSDSEEFFRNAFYKILDHGEPFYIYPAHYLKFTCAVQQEVRLKPSASWVPTLLAACNRFLNEPIKRKHVRRTIMQSRAFVEAQGF